jgi:hypothetical protein
MATLAQRVRFEPLDDRAIETEPLVTLRPKDAIRARAVRRESPREVDAIGVSP